MNAPSAIPSTLMGRGPLNLSWILAFVVAFLTAALGLFVAGTVAALSVDWYRISSFEGGSGYFVVFLALFGGIAGFALGLVVAVVVKARPLPGFLKALGAAWGVVLLLGGATAGVARLLADVPPEIDGQALFVNLELRWPDGQAPGDAMKTQLGVVTLGALSGSTVRATEEGPLFTDLAAHVGDHWVMPGEVRVFTGRGKRLLLFRIGDTDLPAFALPLDSSPVASDREWSRWLPDGGNADIDKGFRYRYRIRLANETLRTESIGPFSVAVKPDGYFHVTDSEFFAAESSFSISVNGAAVPGLEDITSVSVLPGEPALLIMANNYGPCRVLHAAAGQAQIEEIGSCGPLSEAGPLTSDQARFDDARRTSPLRGWLDRTTFKDPGLYQINQMVFDTRTRRVQPFTYLSEFPPHGSVPPLTLSPDERSFVILATDRENDAPALTVFNRETGQGYALPIDRPRMRFADEKEIGPAWIAHHFAWQSGADGERLQERTGFVPLPHHGWLELAKKGEFQSYTLRPGSAPLRAAVVRLLTEAGGQLLNGDPTAYEQKVRIDGHEIGVGLGESPSYVMVTMSGEHSEPALMADIARRLDAGLATGSYDQLFIEPPPPTP
jgi:hypothetical protein